MKRLLKVSTHDTNFRESFVFSAEKTLTEYLCIEAKRRIDLCRYFGYNQILSVLNREVRNPLNFS